MLYDIEENRLPSYLRELTRDHEPLSTGDVFRKDTAELGSACMLSACGHQLTKIWNSLPNFIHYCNNLLTFNTDIKLNP